MNLDTARLATERRPTPRAASSDYEVDGRQPSTCRSSRCSTCVNEELIDEGRGADRLRPRLPRGHLRHLRLGDQRRAARPAARHHHLPAAHAQLQGRRRRSSIEPWRAKAFPVIKDLVVDRSAFDRIIAGRRLHLASAPAARPTPTPSRSPKDDADVAMDAAACIGCGACVAACPNASAMLFVGGQGRPPGTCCRRASPSATAASSTMVAQMDAEGFGNCTNHYECEAACPKEISRRASSPR